MSLKFFHLFFITVAFLLAVFCAWWGFTEQATVGFTYSCIAGAVGLVVYGLYGYRRSHLANGTESPN